MGPKKVARKKGDGKKKLKHSSGWLVMFHLQRPMVTIGQRLSCCPYRISWQWPILKPSLSGVISLGVWCTLFAQIRKHI